MKRRSFIKKTAAGIVLPGILNGLSVKAFGNSPLAMMLSPEFTQTDRVLVLIQLNGGNDGLNMVLNLDRYGELSTARASILIPQNSVLPLNGQTNVGLHPAMTGLQSMYNDGKLLIVQGVGYPQQNFSHFRSTDIWMTASNSNQSLATGWIGRYLNNEYPNFPNGYPNATMPDPLAIQIGSSSAIAFQGPSFPMSMTINSVSSFYNLVNGIQDPVSNTPAGFELDYIRTIHSQSQSYTNSLLTAAGRVTTHANYPTGNALADQLKIIVKLIKGGLQTRVYMVSLGGFDTHSAQVDAADTRIGEHADLLGTLSEAIKAFQDDLAFQGIEDRVLGMTFSEFGRRIISNGSGGTDHGSGAPMFIFGQNLHGGVLGTSPTIPSAATAADNISMQYDFRSVYASIMKDWFCLPDIDLQAVMLQNFQHLPIVNAPNCLNLDARELNQLAGENLLKVYPSPFTSSTNIEFQSQGGHCLLHIFNTLGQEIAVLEDDTKPEGTHQVNFDGSNLPNGLYYVRLQNEALQQVKPMMKVGG